jgi:hypothetical protein
MSIERKADYILKEANRLAEKAAGWADFSAALFDYSTGLVTKTFPNEMERQAFFDSCQYDEVNKLLIKLMKKFGTIEGANRKEKSGRFNVRVAKTLHLKLETEAKLEGVSLNQLVASKLAIPLEKSAQVAAKDLVIEAFNKVHEGYSPDWMIVEPHHNELFIAQCRALKLDLSEFWLNHLLMDVRKNPKYKGRLNRTTKRSGFSDYDDCAFAAEIAIRTIQRTRGVTLDHTLCDPILRVNFDEIATRLVRGITGLKLRCAALNLRKTHRLKPIDLSLDKYDLVAMGPLKTISLSDIAASSGTYAFYDRTRPIFAGETDNLRKRIETHLKTGLPDWLEARRDEDFILKSLVLPSMKREARLQWLTAFINREKPVLNYQKAG